MPDISTIPVLYSFRRCPYAMRARLAVQACGRQVQLREVVLRNKPQQMLDISVKATVPVLQLTDGAVIEESLQIMLWALQNNDPQQLLSPDKNKHEQMLVLIADNDGSFKHNLDRYKYGNRYENADPLQHRAAGLQFLQVLDGLLRQSAYLFGEQPSLADIAVFPFIRQFAGVDRKWFEQSVPKAVQSWLSKWLSSAEFGAVMTKYPAWNSEDPVVLFPEADS
ncbi:MAG: glutathione S-transferase [Robiginitomaculum sp.]|nr:glutathione S-transferase [Robiginitomaculum sp.]